MIQLVDMPGSVSSHMALTVMSNGAWIFIQAGAFAVARKDYALTETQTFLVESLPETTSLTVYLSRDKSTGECFALVDQAPLGESYVSDPSDPQENLYLLITATIPPNTTSLDNVPITVYRRIYEAPNG